MNGRVYYNEIDPFTAAWLRELIAAGDVPAGAVDERDIRDVLPSDLDGYDQCHFFAGIAGWPLALRMSGWPDDRPVWTGSCPCQPFSAAGRRGGTADERHLWPAWHHLIRECRPATIFGEQVEAAIRHDWLDLVFADLEGEDYACGAAVLGAHSVGAPHIRQRLWWVANADSGRRGQAGCYAYGYREARVGGSRDRLSDGCAHDVGHGLGNASTARLEGRDARAMGHECQAAERAGAACAWSHLEWLPCRDGKARPAQRRLQSMVDGLWPSMVDSGEPYLTPLTKSQVNRVGMLRGAGNAIVPQVAAEVIRAFVEVCP